MRSAGADGGSFPDKRELRSLLGGLEGWVGLLAGGPPLAERFFFRPTVSKPSDSLDDDNCSFNSTRADWVDIRDVGRDWLVVSSLTLSTSRSGERERERGPDWSVREPGRLITVRVIAFAEAFLFALRGDGDGERGESAIKDSLKARIASGKRCFKKSSKLLRSGGGFSVAILKAGSRQFGGECVPKPTCSEYLSS